MVVAGLMVLAAAKAFSASSVAMTDIRPGNLPVALQLGAAHALDQSQAKSTAETVESLRPRALTLSSTVWASAQPSRYNNDNNNNNDTNNNNDNINSNNNNNDDNPHGALRPYFSLEGRMLCHIVII